MAASVGDVPITTVLITGGAGFIGSTIASACLDAGLQPVILDNLSTGRREFTAGRTFYEGDIADGALLDKIFAEHPEISATVHCAALTVVPDSVENPIRYYRENVGKTLELIEGILRNGCHRLVFSSSASVYAAGAGAGESIDESAPVEPASPYARTKAVTEWVLEDIARTGAIKAIALRYFNPIGADPEFRSGNPNPDPSHVLGRMIKAYENAETFQITGTDWPTRDGSAIRDYIHVWDLAEAHVAVLRGFDEIVGVTQHSDGRIPYEVINLGTGDGTTVRELADAFQAAVPGELRINDAPRRPGDVIGARTDVGKAGRLLGWVPRLSVADGIRDALAWSEHQERARGVVGAPGLAAAVPGSASVAVSGAVAVSASRAPEKPRETVVDVLMPYYGDVPMMREAVRSVLAQDDPRWRLTVVDDGREPGVPEWFAGLIAERGDGRVRYQRNAENLGITANLQKCLSLVEEDLVTMIGSDDRLLTNYVGTVLDLYERHPEATLVQPGVEVIDDTGAVAEPWIDKAKRRFFAPHVHGSAVLGGEDLAVRLLRGNWMYFPAVCWRAEAITAVGFNQDPSVVQDLALTLERVRSGALLAVGDTVCFQYRRHAVSVSSAQAVSGARFAEERRFFLDEAGRMDGLGWIRAAKTARHHLSSRVHALVMLPAAVRRGSGAGVRTLTGYAFGPAREAGR